MKASIAHWGIFFCLFAAQTVTAQTVTAQTGTAPQQSLRFSVIELSAGLHKISWNNPYRQAVQLAVQRSTDSLQNFRTILSAKNPELEENGFTDHTAPHSGNVFYRIFVTMEGGGFFFTPVVKAQKAAAVVPKAVPKPAAPVVKKDSILPPKIVVPENPFLNKKPSKFVYTDARGYLVIALPKAAINRYKLIIYDTNGSILFTIEHIRETELIVEKVNFLHSGWFNFELLENGLLLEQNRFYIQ
ncbi:MAG: hypothetical protein WAZ36_07555 [Sediminibacterium sp.]